MNVAIEVIGGVGLAGATAAQFLRWLRVLQREHYVPSSLRHFVARWASPPVAPARRPASRRRPVTGTHIAMLFLVLAALVRSPELAVADAIVYGVFLPEGLSLRGRTGALRWTRRLATTAGVAVVLALLVEALGLAARQPWIAGVAIVWAVPLILEVAARAVQPYQDREAGRFVARARERLTRVAPTVVGVTGSYGKTSTKNHLVQLIGPGAVGSPRSFNNRAGLSRAINENLTDGTRVFVAEMGTFGPGEIRALCEWCPPSIAVVTAIGPVHLERMGSLEVIESAKFEITERASTIVLNADDPRLAGWVERLRARGARVVTAGSSRDDLDVRVVVEPSRWRVIVDGVEWAGMEPVPGVQPTNLACALAAAREVGAEREELVSRLRGITPVANRSQVGRAPSGVTVIDDTFNANPASARAALDLLCTLPVTGRRVLVTPGMVELGGEQYHENLRLAQAAHARDVELVVVGRTNAVPLTRGYGDGARRVDRRDEAVAWVRQSLGEDDAVLYLNDLPDHYP